MIAVHCRFGIWVCANVFYLDEWNWRCHKLCVSKKAQCCFQ